MMSDSLPKNISVFGIAKVRNEEEIIQETLDYYSPFCDKIFIYDDCSTDNTVEICRRHPKVAGVIEGKYWNPNRVQAEYQCRQAVFELAKQGNPDWFLYFDADERMELPSDLDLSQLDGIRCKLFDFYITLQDVDKHYSQRQWIGPEYREILMMFRNLPGLEYKYLDQREMVLPPTARIANVGYVRHYGKAVSVKQWEETCAYYSTYWNEPYKSKWEARKGKAIHIKSDFGADLVKWEDRELEGFPL